MKRLIILLVALSSAASAWAENNPYRSDYLWVTVPDHADWLYKTGENARVRVEFFKYGIPRDGEIEYTLADDRLEADRSGTATLKGGTCTIDMGTRRLGVFSGGKYSFSGTI